LLDSLTWPAVAVAAIVIFAIRPITARLSLIGIASTPAERNVISFFGIRGIGSLYYTAYALRSESFDDASLLWATVSFTIVLSLVVHGIAATPALKILDDR
jgi:NhaP-type Na+/H+ or K+/H+ antiporter